MGADLQFEKPILELRNKIIELKNYTKETNIDLSAEINIEQIVNKYWINKQPRSVRGCFYLYSSSSIISD